MKYRSVYLNLWDIFGGSFVYLKVKGIERTWYERTLHSNLI